MEEWEGLSKEELIAGLNRYFSDLKDVKIYTCLLGELIEGYLVAAQYLKEVPRGTIDKKVLLQKIVKEGEARQAEENIFFPESISVQTYSNALLLFERQGFLKMVKSADKFNVEILDWNESMTVLTRQLSRFIGVMAESFSVAET